MPQRGLTVPLEEGGPTPSLIAVTLSQEEVWEADAVADVARLAGGWAPPRVWTLISVRPVFAPEALVARTRMRWALIAGNRTRL